MLHHQKDSGGTPAKRRRGAGRLFPTPAFFNKMTHTCIMSFGKTKKYLHGVASASSSGQDTL
eukprot:6390349-Karenia_brevis.AAC.1